MERYVLLYYCYEPIQVPSDLAESQKELCKSLGLSGRIRVAKEGLNGTLSGPLDRLEAYQTATEAQLQRHDIDWKVSKVAHDQKQNDEAFGELMVKIVKDLVGWNNTERVYSVERSAYHLSPQEYHEKLSEDVEHAILDIRNTYEYELGHFKDAIDPGTRQFGEFEDWFREEGVKMVADKPRVFMYCTGGIRCEKASIAVRDILESHLGTENVPELYQLKGGIHRYLETFGPKESKFLGRNFVFDKRVAQPVPEPFADQEDAVQIVGKCYYCQKPWEEFREEHRCNKCRMLVLVCDMCGANVKLYCRKHSHLDPRKTTTECTLASKYELVKQLESLVGLADRNAQKQRSKITKKLAELETVLQELLA